MRPRLLIVSLSLDVGGTERHIAEIAPRLAANGFDVAVALLARRGVLADAVAAKSVRVIAPPALLGSIGGTIRLLAELLLNRPRIAHFFLPMPYLAGGLLALALQIPVRIMSRRSQNDYQGRRPRLARLEHWLHRHMTAILANSPRVLGELRAEGVPDERLRLIYNGVDLARFAGPTDRNGTRRQWGVPEEALVLAILANLIPYKGHADLIEALRLIRDRLPDGWRLLAIGRDDGIGAGLARQCEAAGIAANVLWLGARRDVPALLAAADIGLLTSHEEGFANAVIEGMAAGLPMVVTDVGGNREAIGSDQAGIAVPPRDPARLAAAILELVGDRDRLRRLGEAGRDRARRLYSIEACVTEYEILYRGLLKPGRA